MSSVAIHDKVLLGKEKTAKYWPVEKPVVCFDPKSSWPTFLVCRHETIGGTRVANYVFLPPGMTLSQVSWQVCRDICKAVAELALRRVYVVDVHPFYKTLRSKHVRYRVETKTGRVSLYIDWGFSMETHWEELSLALSGIRDHLKERR